MDEKKLRFDTLQVHGGQVPDPATGSRAVPIYQTTSYTFRDSEHAKRLFALEEEGNIYTRIMNPTTDVFEKRMAALEGGIGALATSSGSSAIFYAVTNIAHGDDEIISSSTIYGGTYNLFSSTLKNYGITARFAESDDPQSFRELINEKTKLIFIESLGNPGINIIDMEALAKIAHENHIPLIVDNTFATPYLLRPFDYGADIVVHSATKFIGGHGTSIGGIIVDGGRFDYAKSGKFPMLVEKDPSYHHISYTETFKEAAYLMRARVVLLRDTGACISPFNSFLFLQGLETLSLRVEKHVSNTEKIIGYLKDNEHVSWINYPGLESSKYYNLAKKYFPRGAGSIFTFGLKGGTEVCKKFIDSLEIFSHLANVADAKSLVIHPASTTHSQLSEKDQKNAGVLPDMIRVSVGIEDPDDLIEDIERAINIAISNPSEGMDGNS